MYSFACLSKIPADVQKKTVKRARINLFMGLLVYETLYWTALKGNLNEKARDCNSAFY